MLVQHFLENSCREFPRKTALVSRGSRWSYQEIEERANQLAGLLRSRGLSRGDRVAIQLDNSPEAVISLFAVLKAGGVFLLLHPQVKAEKIGFILNNCQASFFVSDPAKVERISSVLSAVPSLKGVLCAAEGAERPAGPLSALAWKDMESFPKTAQPAPYPGSIDLDLATIIYTSGSTGVPKGVMLTHLNMVSAANSITTYLENRPEDIILNVLPLSFDYGLYQVLMAFKLGGTVVLERSFTYPYEILKLMAREGVTGFPGVPTIFAILLQLKDLSRYPLPALRYITNTAAPLPPAHIQKLRAAFPQARLYSMYGLTECKRVSYLPPEELDRRPRSVGRGMPNEEVWIVDGEGNRLGPGRVGELVVRGSNIMRGYWSDPEATDRVLRPGPLPGERVLYTGDLFQMDEEGYLYFVGRKDDLIKTRGERVSPKEVEEAILSLEGVFEVAVIPLADEILGQAVKACIVPRNGCVLSEKEVLLHCREVLEEFAVPKYIEFREALPKTSSGKIDKLALKQEGESRRAAGPGRDLFEME